MERRLDFRGAMSHLGATAVIMIRGWAGRDDALKFGNFPGGALHPVRRPGSDLGEQSAAVQYFAPSRRLARQFPVQ